MIALADSSRTLIDELLTEQGTMTAVAKFSRLHERREFPAQAKYYRDLIPFDRPQLGQQYAFAVDLDACTGCKACVSACHSLNGLDDDEVWRDVGVIFGGTALEPYQQTVTTACHHCAEPACLLGCPVRAYEKAAETGIVRHLDDQCIGCQYCVLKCPYDVPKYSKNLGIVRKCDMCYNRLAADEAPACVQACPNGAITIQISTIAEARAGSRLPPGAFDSSYTKPTTSYTTRKKIPANTRPGDTHLLRLEHAHWPLIGMLLLTQLSAGMFAAALFAPARGTITVIAFVLLNLGLAISVLHLGRPLGAWRAFLGLRTSWMSREIFTFSAFAGAAAAFTFLANWKAVLAAVPALEPAETLFHPAQFTMLVGMGTALLALLGVFCSAMIYVDTRRVFWSAIPTFTKFFGTMLLLGSAGTAATLAWLPFPAAAHTFAALALGIRAVLFFWETNEMRSGLLDRTHPAHRSMATIWKFCRPLVWTRLACFIAANVSMILAIFGSGTSAAVLATFAFVLTFISQAIERYFFFTAVIAPRMPGGVAS